VDRSETNEIRGDVSVMVMRGYRPSEPTIVERVAQPYFAIRGLVTMRTIGAVADRFPEVFGYLAARGIEPAAAPFLKYNLIDMDHELEIEAGVPVASELNVSDVSDEVFPSVLPGGRYATVTQIGPPDALMDVTSALLAWAADRDLHWDRVETTEGERWGCRLEIFKTDPSHQPDVNKWETELAFRLAD
jgi:GyrI-like small molecule binding domain